MMPEAITRDGLKWHVRLCLTVPPAAPPLLSIGHQGLLRVKEKILMFFHLTRANTAQFLQPGQEPLSVVVPIVYDIEHNNTTVAHNHKEMNPVVSAGNFKYFDEKNRSSMHLKCQFFSAQQILNSMAQSGRLNMQSCTIMPCVRELLGNLRLPNEGPDNSGPPMMHPGMARPQMGPGMPMGPGQQMGPGMMRMMRGPGPGGMIPQQQQHGFMN